MTRHREEELRAQEEIKEQDEREWQRTKAADERAEAREAAQEAKITADHRPESHLDLHDPEDARAADERSSSDEAGGRYDEQGGWV